MKLDNIIKSEETQDGILIKKTYNVSLNVERILDIRTLAKNNCVDIDELALESAKNEFRGMFREILFQDEYSYNELMDSILFLKKRPEYQKNISTLCGCWKTLYKMYLNKKIEGLL
jgi:hypothetical protein